MKTSHTKHLRLISLCLFVSLSLSSKLSYSQLFGQRVRGIEVKELGMRYYTDISGVEIKSLDLDDFTVSLKLVDPAALNNYFYELDRLNGKLEYTVFDASREKFFIKKKRKKRTKSDSEYLLEGLRWLLQSEKIDDDLYQKIYRDIIATYEDAEAEVETFEFKHEYYNPYFIGDKYLSLFELEITNKSSSSKRFKYNVELTADNNSTLPLSDYEILDFINKYINTGLYIENFTVTDNSASRIIESFEQNTYSKSLALNRVNFKPDMVIPANQKVKKYLSMVPVDNANGKFDIHFIDENTNSKVHWNVVKQRSIVDETYYYYELVLNPNGEGTGYREYEFIEYVNGQADAYIDGDLIFINKNDVGESIEIFCYALSSGGKLNYGTHTFKASDFIDLTKNRRQEIEYELNEIEGISKKVKNK